MIEKLELLDYDGQTYLIGDFYLPDGNRVRLFGTEYARLFAAAPDLLEATKEMVHAMERYEMSTEEPPPYEHRAMMEKAYTAIAKAQGTNSNSEPT